MEGKRTKESGECMVDWAAIKTEYITTQISTRDIAKKYGVSHSQIARRSSREKWAQHRETLRNETETLWLQKTAEAVSDVQTDRSVQLMEGGQLSVELLIERLREMKLSGKIKTYEVKAITEALKNVRDLYKTDERPSDDDPLIKYMEEMRNA